MNGQWYIVAFSALLALLAFHSNFPIFLIFFLGWILFLYRTKRAGLAVTVLSLISFAYFTFFTPSPLESPTLVQLGDRMTLTGKINSSISHFPTRLEFILALPPPEESNVLVTYFIEQEIDIPSDWKRGAVCRISGTPEIPPGSTNPGQFDFHQYLLHQNITHQIVLEELNKIQCTGSSVVSLIDHSRQQTLKRINTELKPETASWIKALLFGSREGIPEDLTERFQESGLSHLLAISGLHVGLLAGMAYFFLLKGNVITREKAGSLLIAVLPMYVFMAGESPSVWRACLMGTGMILLSKTTYRLTVMDVFSIVFLLTLVFDPYSAYQLSFQFSFLVTFALLLSRQLLKEIRHFFFTPLTITLISQLAILPIQIDQFYYLNPFSPFANFLFVPYFTLFVVPMILLLVFVLFTIPIFLPVTEKIFLSIHEKALSFLVYISDFDSLWVIGDIPSEIYFGYFGLFLLFMAKWTAGFRLTAFKYSCLIVMLFWIVSLKPYFSELGTVTALDVGQGDSLVIELPKRKGIILIDVGGTISHDFQSVSNKSYQQVLKPYLYSKGITRIDALFLTHPDLDHAGNFNFIKNDFKIENVLVSKWFGRDANDSSLIGERERETFTIVQSATPYMIEGQRFHVLSPEGDLESPNENSLVLYTELGGMNWLFTGDIEEKAEREIIKRFPDLDVDVLKVAHHGSKTSSNDAFLRQLTPQQALITVGRDNRYGHPADETIKKLSDMGIEIHRTDKNGAIQFLFTQKERKFTHFITK